jgi:ribosomal protein L17
MRNTLGDLNNHLFAQLERLSDEELTGEKLTEEINRAKAVTSVASQIIANGSLVLEARRLADDRMNTNTTIPKMLEG